MAIPFSALAGLLLGGQGAFVCALRVTFDPSAVNTWSPDCLSAQWGAAQPFYSTHPAGADKHVQVLLPARLEGASSKGKAHEVGLDNGKPTKD